MTLVAPIMPGFLHKLGLIKNLTTGVDFCSQCRMGSWILQRWSFEFCAGSLCWRDLMISHKIKAKVSTTCDSLIDSFLPTAVE